MSSKKVAIVILSWNGRKYLEQFMPSVMQHTSSELCEIIVADNLSSDDSIAFLQQHYPTVRIIQNQRNGGYAGGYNDALKLVDTEYYVLLNQDIEVTEGWVEKVIAEMDKDTSIAAAQPKIRAYNSKDEFEYAGACGGYLDRFGYPFCRGRVFEVLEKDNGQYDTVADIFWASGACLFVRRSAFWNAGGLDEDFFAHQEEIDLCWRMKNQGQRIICVPQSLVYHVGGGSLGYGSPFKTYLNFRNSLFMLFKNLPAWQVIWKISFRIQLDNIAAIKFLFGGGGFKAYWAVVRSQFAFLAAVPSLIRKRRSFNRSVNTPLFPKSIIYNFFVRGKKTYNELLQD